MSKDKKEASVTSLPDKCPVADCKKGVHFAWYKEGLINKRGLKPTDFDKKYQNFMRKRAA